MEYHLSDEEILFYLNNGYDEENLRNDEMSTQIKKWADETIMKSLGIEGFLEEKEMFGVE